MTPNGLAARPGYVHVDWTCNGTGPVTGHDHMTVAM